MDGFKLPNPSTLSIIFPVVNLVVGIEILFVNIAVTPLNPIVPVTFPISVPDGLLKVIL